MYDAVLDWGLNPGPPALEASTITLGYRGGGYNLGFHFRQVIAILCIYKAVWILYIHMELPNFNTNQIENYLLQALAQQDNHWKLRMLPK